ncbi:hypothetical protein ASD65_14290 [Microbacterium sp. Root61]|uniref:MarR family winged helix-turn-helix transcriptional regulator n=1 Tax=Microbacterium sp. Root61 TaxID=1736570 RepID=UPI0006FF81DE|nr:MarR family winged helix-turn-helix transcriptional regulator [Microbacterium sp. Root61]KRA25458.1 hypothetical protein ASD65_14290 [Microbacterium sp. Root61]
MPSTDAIDISAALRADPALEAACGHLLRRSQQVHNAIWAEELGSELTSPQYSLLASVAAWPGIDQRRAGELASLDKSSTMEVVARLVRKAWITRHRDPRDARRDVLALTPAATLALEDLTPRVQHVQSRLLAPLPSDERDRFVADLAVIARLDTVSDDDPNGDGASSSPLWIPGHLVRRAQQVHTALFAEEFDHELTGPQFATMYVLARHPEISQRKLGALAALDKSTAADIVDRLARRGWLLSHRDPADRRRSVLSLTDDAQRAATAYAPRVEAVQQRVLEPLPASRRAVFLTALTQVAIPSAD